MSFFKSIFNKHLPIVLSLIVVVVIGLVLVFGFGEKKAESAWYSSGGTWSYRKQITIDHTKVATTSALTNFPMLFSVTDPDLKYTSFGGKVASTTGGDILFTSSNGSTLLDYEIEKYASTTGELIVWIEVPSLSGVTDTDLFVYFGNASASNTQNPTGVWDSNYKGVWHLPNGTTLTALDSTSNASHGTLRNTPTATAGRIDGGMATNGGTQDVTGSLVSGNVNTTSCWMKYSSSLPDFTFGLYAAGGAETFLRPPSAGNMVVSILGSGFTDGTTLLSTNTWYYVVTTRNGSNTNEYKAYLNGAIEVTTTRTFDDSGSTTFYIGSKTGTAYWGGSLDECRYSNIVRGSDWIATEYNNQSSPSNFYSYGAIGVESRTNTSVKQAYKGSSSITWYNSAWLYRSQITVDRSKVATTSALTNFPVLVSITRPDLKYTSFGGKVASTTGGDLLFTNADGSTLLDYEIEKYASTTGELIAWVEVPSLSGVTDTNLFVYFGNASASNTQNPTGVWDSNFKGVWHLKDGTTLDSKDSTSNANNGTPTAGITASAGKIDGAAKGDGTLGHQTQTTLTTNFGDVTVCAWFNDPSGTVNYERLVDKNYSTGFWLGRNAGTANSWGGGVVTGGTNFIFVTLADGSWHYICLLRSGTVNTVIGDGGAVTNTISTNSTAMDANPVYFFDSPSAVAASNVILDEVRISNIARGTDWIATEYNNQSNPGSFLLFGGTQAQTSQTSSGAPAPQMKVRGGVKFK